MTKLPTSVCIFCVVMIGAKCRFVPSSDCIAQTLDPSSVVVFAQPVINPRRACARVTVVVLCVCLCIRLFPLWLLQRPLKPANNGTHGFLLGLICVEFRKNLPFKSYGVKKPICK